MIAAYRDQHKITTEDPRQVLGPYAETGRAGHRAYWHAAESVLAARRLAGLEPANGASADARARAQIAADTTVAHLMTSAPGSPQQSPPPPARYGSAIPPDPTSTAQRRGT